MCRVNFECVSIYFMNILLVFLPLTIIMLFVARRMHFFTFESATLNASVPFKDLFGAFLFFLGSHLVIVPSFAMIGIRVFSLSMDNSITQGWMMIGSMLISSLMLFFYTSNLISTQTRRLIWRGERTFSRSAFAYGVLSFILSYPLVITLGQMIKQVANEVFQIVEKDQTAVRALKQALDDPAMSAVMIFCIVGIVPVVEEMLFRGYLQTWLRGFWNSKISIVVTSVIFAVFHYSFQQGWSNIELLISLFVLSLFLGLIYEKKESLWAPIGLHVTFNFVNVGVLLFFS